MSIQKNFIECSWGKIHYAEVNKNQSTTILCLHGWIDNWASFLPISDLLPFRLIILDLPGHGHSGHLPKGCSYHFVDYIVKLKEIVNKLELVKFHILGHSMGAAIGCLFAATFQEYVLSLTMIDGLGPLVNSPDEARDILRESILKMEKRKGRKRVFKDKELAVKARLSAGPLSYESAKILVEHQLRENEEGYSWSYDHKLKNTSSLRLSPAQLESFLKNLNCPTLLITASEGYIIKSPYWEKRKLIKNLCVEELTGQHHLHMDAPQETAELIKRFLRLNF